MGIFTWTDAAIENPQMDDNYNYPDYCVVNYEGYAKLICPDDTEIETEHHDYYGRIGGYDIYELVAEWNRFYLDAGLIEEVPDVSEFGGLWSFEIESLRKSGKPEEEIQEMHRKAQEEHWKAAIGRRNRMAALFDEYKTGASESELSRKYGKYWKRDIGIEIACRDENAKKLKYPIKLTKRRDAHGYDNLYISYSTQ